MAARGPESLLDRREAESGVHVVRDRLTRQRSPARSPKRRSQGAESDEEISVRIDQPYRTSFSAVLPPTRSKKERSRSTSPGTSSLKGSSRSRSKSPGGGRSRPKHVRYDDNVVIRESGTSDSIVTNLSDKDMNDTSGHYSATSSMLSANDSKMSQDSSQERDYSSELRELSQQIVREYSYPNDKENLVENSSHNQSARTPNGNISSKESQNSCVVKPKPKMVVTDAYDHDRSISYRAAIKDHYSDEVKRKAESLIEEEAPLVQRKPRESKESKRSESPERRNSLPVDKDDTSNKLTPAKRSISSSIGNFFRRLSPHLPRRHKKGNLSTASSVSLSPDDLDGSFDRRASTGNLSRNKFRRSLQRLFGKSKKGGKSPRGNSSVDDVRQQDHDSSVQNKSTPTTSVYMKSIEQGTKSDDDVYHKFKNRNVNRSGEVNTPVRPQAMRASPRVTSPGADSGFDRSRSQELPSPENPQGTSSLNVKWKPKQPKSFQGSQISGLSMDDSIGECSINPNISGKRFQMVT